MMRWVEDAIALIATLVFVAGGTVLMAGFTPSQQYEQFQPERTNQ